MFSWQKKKRNYGLSEAALRRIAASYGKNGSVPNPYRPGCYHFIIEALKALGVNQPHPHDLVKAKVEELMGEKQWQAFASREREWSRIGDYVPTRADVDQRLHCNCRVLQRVNDYGLKLLQVGKHVMKTRGCVVDIVIHGRAIAYRLNTNADVPQSLPRRVVREKQPSLVSDMDTAESQPLW